MKKKRRFFRLRNKILLLLVILYFLAPLRFYIPQHIAPPKNEAPKTVTLQTTGYCPCGKCCSYHRFLFVIPYQKTGMFSFRFKKVGVTYSGTMAHPGTIAADLSIYPLGTIFYVPNYGYGRVEDIGSAIKGQHIDLFFPSHQKAAQWGVKKQKVQVWLPPKAK
jgi:3D (Asp-Asp-Asp) domain-containing protein